jgi:hypothetical protein
MKRRIVVATVILAVFLVVIGLWLVWGSWISPVEERAMKSALDRIDEVSKYEGDDRAVFERRLQEAQSAILLCKRREITAYDRQLVPALDLQLEGAQAEHKARLKAESDPQYSRMLKVVEDTNRKSEAVLREHLQ